jgi:N-acetylglutamate synthase-like GNAT family acetyltransferase
MSGIRRLRPAEYERLKSALAAEGLPADDICGAANRFYALEEGGHVLGYAGLERHGGAVLLRSVVVPAERRGSGAGRRLVEAVLDEAARLGHREIHLLTMTAAAYFERLGFERVPREHAPAGVRSSAQFISLCPGSAVLMRRRLEPRGGVTAVREPRPLQA